MHMSNLASDIPLVMNRVNQGFAAASPAAQPTTTTPPVVTPPVIAPPAIDPATLTQLQDWSAEFVPFSIAYANHTEADSFIALSFFIVVWPQAVIAYRGELNQIRTFENNLTQITNPAVPDNELERIGTYDLLDSITELKTTLIQTGQLMNAAYNSTVNGTRNRLIQDSREALADQSASVRDEAIQFQQILT